MKPLHEFPPSAVVIGSFVVGMALMGCSIWFWAWALRNQLWLCN